MRLNYRLPVLPNVALPVQSCKERRDLSRVTQEQVVKTVLAVTR